MDTIINIISLKIVYEPILIILFGYILYIILKKLIDSLLLKNNIDKKSVRERRKITLAKLFKNIIKYLIFIISILLILSTFGIDIKTLVAGLGIAGLVIGLAFQDIIKDFLAGIFIILDNQYWIGEIVEINKFKGEVLELGLKTTKIINKNGEIKTIYNRNITEVINYTINNYYMFFDIIIKDNYLDNLIDTISKINEEIKTNKEVNDKFWTYGVQLYENDLITYRVSISVKPNTDYMMKGKMIELISSYLKQNEIEFSSIKAVDPNE